MASIPNGTSPWCRPAASPKPFVALLTGKVQAAALSVPATMRARKANMRELLDMATLEATIHQNGVVTTRKYLKTNEDTVRRFLRAFIEGGALAKKDKAFATRVMAKYLGTNDREILDDAYERVTLHLEIPPYPSVEGVSVLLKTLEKAQPKARTANPEDFIDSRLVRELDKSGFIDRLVESLNGRKFLTDSGDGLSKASADGGPMSIATMKTAVIDADAQVVETESLLRWNKRRTFHRSTHSPATIDGLATFRSSGARRNLACGVSGDSLRFFGRIASLNRLDIQTF